MGLTEPSPPPSIIAGPPIPILEFFVAIIVSQHPSNAALPAKQYPETIPTNGDLPLRPANILNVVKSRPATPFASVSPGLPPPPSANKTIGRRHLSAILSIRSIFLWFIIP